MADIAARIARAFAAAWLSFALAGCAVYTPPVDVPRDYLARARSQTSGDITVSAVVLSDDEAEQVFDAPLARKDIQLIWIEIENRGDRAMAVNFLAIDDEYFSPSEAALMARRFGERRSDSKARFFNAQNLPLVIDGESSESGFVFTNHDPGAKAFEVELFGYGTSHRFEFAALIPGFEADFVLTQPDTVYTASELMNLDIDALHAYIESLPCCVAGDDLETPGDPLNVVFVAEGGQLLNTLVGRGWDLTETLRLRTSWRSIVSSVFRSRYRTSPVSPLFLFDRPQDAAFQKARRTVDERNHMRVWRAPVNLNGVPVWVGQISRDIGVKLTRRGFVTHRIDSVVDEARGYLALDIIESGRLASFGYSTGVGVSTLDDPRYNYTRDPYYTDGLRSVMILSDERVGFDQLVDLDWEDQPRESVLQASGATSERIPSDGR